VPDWIETFVRDTEGIQSPESFRLWTGITIIAGALERRVWTETDRGMLFPNQFTILCGFPASGKTLMINEARKYWIEVPQLHVGPDNPSRRSFLDTLQKSTRDFTNGTGAVIYSAMSVPSTELGVLFANSDEDFFATLTDLYDNKDQFTAPRSSTSSVHIERPTVNILGGATPDYIGTIFPEVAWGGGFTSRLVFIYGAEIHDPSRDVFKKKQDKITQDGLQQDLCRIFLLSGECLWEPDAMKALNAWFSERLPPIPDHNRLTHYKGRRGPHVLKLSMISAVSYHQSLTVTLGDFLRAKKWLLDAEEKMPDVFRAMRQKSDEQLIRESYHHLYSIYSSVVREKRQAIPESVLWDFLYERATSDKIPGIITAMERSDLIRRGTKPGTYVPQPRPGL
jgi:hypothetical protein